MAQQQQPPGMAQMLGEQPPQDMSGNSYYPQENDLTGGLPINLDSLRDGPPGSKPFYPYSTLIRFASKLSLCLQCVHILLQLCNQRIAKSEIVA